MSCRLFVTYRVSHIKLDHVNGSKLRFGGNSEKGRNNHFEKFNEEKEFFFAENATFFKIYVRILALKIGDNLI